jgi:hypothetical protein
MPPALAALARALFLVHADSVLATDDLARVSTNSAAPLCSFDERDFLLAVRSALLEGRDDLEPHERDELFALFVRASASPYVTFDPKGTARLGAALRTLKLAVAAAPE